jgi:hypothetical protein
MNGSVSLFDVIPPTTDHRPGLTPSGRVFHSLPELGWMSMLLLEQLYRNSFVPELASLEGAHDGLFLGFRGPFLPADRPLRALARQPWFPWCGKHFDIVTAQGLNRLSFGRERLAFPFDLQIGPSLLDDNPCLIIDYDRPENPAFVRRVRDELRSPGPSGPGLLLGPSFWRGRSPHLLMYFGLEVG